MHFICIHLHNIGVTNTNGCTRVLILLNLVNIPSRKKGAIDVNDRKTETSNDSLATIHLRDWSTRV